MRTPKPVARLCGTRRKELRESLPQICVKCGATQKLTLDHIVARALGGSNERHNLQILCEPCNRKKGELERAEAEKRVRQERKLQRAAYFREQARQARAQPSTPGRGYSGRSFVT